MKSDVKERTMLKSDAKGRAETTHILFWMGLVVQRAICFTAPAAHRSNREVIFAAKTARKGTLWADTPRRPLYRSGVFLKRRVGPFPSVPIAVSDSRISPLAQVSTALDTAADGNGSSVTPAMPAEAGNELEADGALELNPTNPEELDHPSVRREILRYERLVERRGERHARKTAVVDKQIELAAAGQAELV